MATYRTDKEGILRLYSVQKDKLIKSFIEENMQMAHKHRKDIWPLLDLGPRMLAVMVPTQSQV